MTDTSPLPSDATQDSAQLPNADGQIPEVDVTELPPVEPPSAGFMLQLFVVPGLIVLLVVGVWALFGKMATGKQDWQALVSDLGSSNPHRQQRAALGLAQLLKLDLETEQDSEGLVKNPRVARALAELLQKQLESPKADKQQLVQQAFLARTLGFIDVPDVVIPALCRAMQTEVDRDIRRNAVASVALILGRNAEGASGLQTAELTERLIELTADEDRSLRQVATFTLALFQGSASQQRLLVLLNNADENTRLNAAFGLARQQSVACLPLLENYLQQALETQGQDSRELADKQERLEMAEQKLRQEPLVLKNIFQAIRDLRGQLDAEQREKLQELVQPLAADYPNSVVRVAARKLLLEFSQPADAGT